MTSRQQGEVGYMYKKVLVPLDGTDSAVCALNHAKDLFRSGAIEEITVLNVVDTSIPWEGEFNSYLDLHSVKNDILAAARKYLGRVESSLRALGVKVKTVFVEGNSPADAIFDYAQKNDINMIVIATHGSSRLKKLFFGGVANAVIQTSPLPVLFIKPEAC